VSVEVGYERVRLGRRHPVRWWVYLFVAQGRRRAPRRGVVDRGFRFARGGLATDEAEAREEIRLAREQAAREWRYWTHQPSHMLGPGGELVPLDEVLLEIEGKTG
jgi:hypothetical protein